MPDQKKPEQEPSDSLSAGAYDLKKRYLELVNNPEELAEVNRKLQVALERKRSEKKQGGKPKDAEASP